MKYDLQLHAPPHSRRPPRGARIEIILPMAILCMRLWDAPHAGARIEIQYTCPWCRVRRDAPHAGARIEIRGQNKSPGHYSQTPPTRGRELKLDALEALKELLRRPPRGGEN